MITDGSAMFRHAPLTPYRASGKITRVPLNALSATIQMLRAARNVEAACFWLGVFDEVGNGSVEAVVVPNQINHARNYEVPSQAMLDVAAVARQNKWTIVGAVHSHPGQSVEHSQYDDQMTPSRRALSIVFPHYGKWSGPWARGVGAHEYIDEHWHLLPEGDAERRIEFLNNQTAQLIDLR
jgi:proteasome lid subunit RPN8/RPN11